MNFRKAGFFDSQADAGWARDEYTAQELAQIKRILDLGGICEGMKVLEPGCGTGRLTRILADRVGPGGRVVAVDISARMVEALLRELGRLGQVEPHWAAVEDLPLPWRGFDAVVCHQVFPHFDDKARALSLFANALAPLGALILFHFMRSAVINQVHRSAHEAVAHDLIPPEAVMRSMFLSAGFHIERLHDDENGYLLISRVIH